MIVVGIDPGLTGGIAIFDNDKKEWLGVFPMPVEVVKAKTKKGKDKKKVDARKLYEMLHPYAEDGKLWVCVEEVHAMPGQGVTSMFTFGEGYGKVLAVSEVLSDHVSTITPRSWQVILYGIKTAEDKLNPKERAKEKALQIFSPRELTLPRARKPHEGMVDAVCIALAASRLLNSCKSLNSKPHIVHYPTEIHNP